MSLYLRNDLTLANDIDIFFSAQKHVESLTEDIYSFGGNQMNFDGKSFHGPHSIFQNMKIATSPARDRDMYEGMHFRIKHNDLNLNLIGFNFRKSPLESLETFDITPPMCAAWGDNFLIHPKALLAYEKNEIDLHMVNANTILNRIKKYKDKGFGISDDATALILEML